MSLSEEQLYRPNFHFSPKNNWMNDPNGMFYIDGTYHLFYQYHPYSSKWGPMHWGHATSKDLITWEEHSIAFYPDEKGAIFSGGAVVDKENTTGFGDGENTPIIALFTYHDHEKERLNKVDVESQAIAFSLDKGVTWEKYANNPVLENQGIKDFRDPKVIWDKERGHWLLALSVFDKTQFYTSKNLKDWTFASDFGFGIGARDGVWECPDFFPLTIEGTQEVKWVLLQSLNPGGPNGGSATQFFVGDFDGKTFVLDEVFQKQLEKGAQWIDWGRDNYAGVTFDNAPEGKRILIAWMNNWVYGQDVPTEQWRGAVTIARELVLRKTSYGYRIVNILVKQLEKYLTNEKNKSLKVTTPETPIFDSLEVDLTKALIDINLHNIKEHTYEFVLSNDYGDRLVFGIDNKNNFLWVDRSKSGKVDFSTSFGNIAKLPLLEVYKETDFKMLLDKTSIEIFFNNGEECITDIFFPNVPYTDFTLITSDKEGFSIDVKTQEIKIPKD